MEARPKTEDFTDPTYAIDYRLRSRIFIDDMLIHIGNRRRDSYDIARSLWVARAELVHLSGWATEDLDLIFAAGHSSDNTIAEIRTVEAALRNATLSRRHAKTIVKHGVAELTTTNEHSAQPTKTQQEYQL